MLFKTKQQKTSNYDIQAIVYSLPLSIVSHSDTYIYLYCQLFLSTLMHAISCILNTFKPLRGVLKWLCDVKCNYFAISIPCLIIRVGLIEGEEGLMKFVLIHYKRWAVFRSKWIFTKVEPNKMKSVVKFVQKWNLNYPYN